jgi:hypothetical protein
LRGPPALPLACDEFVAADIMVEYPGGQAYGRIRISFVRLGGSKRFGLGAV